MVIVLPICNIATQHKPVKHFTHLIKVVKRSNLTGQQTGICLVGWGQQEMADWCQLQFYSGCNEPHFFYKAFTSPLYEFQNLNTIASRIYLRINHDCILK